MGYAERTMAAGEQVVYRGNLHWSNFITAGLIALFCAIAAGGGAGWGWAVAGLLFVGWAYLRYVNAEFVVTNRRVICKSGVFGTRSVEIMLSKLEAIGVDEPLMGKMLGYGTLVVGGTGGSKEEFKLLAKPLTFRL